MRRIATASAFGSTIEYYDFFLYGTAAALVFPKLFFPNADPVVGTLASFGTFAVGFVARPLGGVVCGHYGDRVGRKAMLIVTLMLMGLSTAAIGLVPTYGTIGVWAPVLLTVLRFVQGFSFGGEIGGAALLTVEHAPRDRRGLWGSVPFTGSPIGQGLSTAVLLVASLALSDEAFLSWGWRVPFLLSLALVAVGLFIRLKVVESPAFRRALARDDVVEQPLLDVIRTDTRQLALNTGLHFGITVTFFMNTVFVVSYVTNTLDLSRTMILSGIIVTNVIFIGVQVAAGALSDRIGRRTMYMVGALWAALMGFPYFLLLDSGSTPLIWLAILLLGLGVYGMYGPQPAFFTELFRTEVRYTAFSLPVALATIIGGSTAPIVATTLIAWANGEPWLVSAYLVFTGLITAACAYASPETLRREEEPRTRGGRFVRRPAEDRVGSGR